VPKPVFAHNATALAVATFYTLLSQFRLVDQQSSFDMMTLLGGGCVSLPGLEFHTGASAKKCGILPGFRKRLKVDGCKDSPESMVTSDSALVYDTSVRPSPPLRYVLVVMSYVPRAYYVPRPGMKPVPFLKGHLIHHYHYRRLVFSLEWLLRRKAEFGDAC
jgi:hypothetical protein